MMIHSAWMYLMILFGLLLILSEYCTSYALTVGLRQQQSQHPFRTGFLDHKHLHRIIPSQWLLASSFPPRTCRLSLYATSSVSSSSSPGDSNSALQENTNYIDVQSVENILLSFRNWYSTPSPLDAQTNSCTSLVSLLSDDVQWDDCHYMYQPLSGIDAVERHLRLQRMNLLGTMKAPKRMVIDKVITTKTNDLAGMITIGFIFQDVERTNGSAEGMAVPNRRGMVILDLTLSMDSGYRICSANVIREKSMKTGEFSLRILSLASKFLTPTVPPINAVTNDVVVVDERTASVTLPELYFDAWNRRDMLRAVSLFTDDITYDDTAFPQAFVGIENLQQHLLKCASCFPETFTFCVDRVVQTPDTTMIIVAWHVENAKEPLPFTNGLSYYEINPLTQKISKGIDFVDSESVKIASITDPLLSLFQYEPIRVVPTITWFVYMYVVFLSEGILPGANALQFETRTWEEVRDLSLNFFLVAPLLQLPFSPSVHPMLEGIFNILLSWAAMFAGFLSDDRRSKPNLLPMFPIVVGMQFLTSAFLLPYLATRTPERYLTHSEESVVKLNDLDTVSKITENRYLGPILAFVGLYSIIWACLGRGDEFGGFTERYQSLIDLLSIDRVGSSFIVDLIIFALFQGWFIDDDMQRRGVLKSEMTELRLLGKVVPFFGLAMYLAFRPRIVE